MVLTIATVQANFGKKFSQLVDGFIYAQPLYVPNIAIQGKGTHIVVYVVTENDSVIRPVMDNRTNRPRDVRCCTLTMQRTWDQNYSIPRTWWRTKQAMP
jgi:hypothetical protein